MPGLMSEPSEDADLVVIGSGAGGLSAALTGALSGLRVILCEKDEQLGGTTATSGGAIWIVGSRQEQAAGIADSIVDGRTYLQHEFGAYNRDELTEAFLGRGAEAIAFLEDNSPLKFDLYPIPDYHADAPGGKAKGRTLATRDFDGRTLGDAFRLIKPPMRRFMVLGGMMVNRGEIPLLVRPFASVKALKLALSLLIRHISDRLGHARGTRLLVGNAMVGRFVKGLLDRGVDIRPATRLVELVKDGNRVTGVFVEDRTGKRSRITAARGVVLATGGPAHDKALMAELAPRFPHDLSVTDEGSTGDGMQAARAIGASIDQDVATPAVWTPASQFREADGHLTIFPYGYLDRGKPGAIAVDAQGLRFANEANSYQDVVTALFANSGRDVAPFGYLIFDAAFLYKYGIGIVPPKSLRVGNWVRRGYIQRGRTLRDLAGQIGLPADALEASVARHNGFARLGKDTDFHKGDSTFNRSNGDASVSPNPCLAEIKQGPFYALRITPATLGTSVGLRTDGNARVIGDDGAPIANLYACGNEMGSVMRGFCPGGGVTLGPAIVFGYLAARDAASAGNGPLYQISQIMTLEVAGSV